MWAPQANIDLQGKEGFLEEELCVISKAHLSHQQVLGQKSYYLPHIAP